jgi:proline iminopeptidase
MHRAVGAILALLIALPAPAATGIVAEPPRDRVDAAAEVVRELRRIVTPEGVEQLQAVRIGGIRQWVSIRGFDRRNPVLLVLHGGPGYTAMPSSWYFSRGWEEYFTVVHWDQRGAGKTYAANDPALVAPTLTPERMLADTEELVRWLRRELGKDRIFVLGHSWGSYLGLTLAQRHPEWLHAYIGLGQLVDTRESERRGWEFAMRQAQASGHAEAIADLRRIAPYPGHGPLPVAHLVTQRKWLGHFGGAVRGRRGSDAELAAVALSPDYTADDIAALWRANEVSEQRLLARVVELDLSGIRELRCPLILFNGRDDHNVSSAVAAEWFRSVRAPSKSLVWFERSAHAILSEEPGKALVSLVRYARPIAERAGDVPPE